MDRGQSQVSDNKKEAQKDIDKIDIETLRAWAEAGYISTAEYVRIIEKREAEKKALAADYPVRPVAIDRHMVRAAAGHY